MAVHALPRGFLTDTYPHPLPSAYAHLQAEQHAFPIDQKHQQALAFLFALAYNFIMSRRKIISLALGLGVVGVVVLGVLSTPKPGYAPHAPPQEVSAAPAVAVPTGTAPTTTSSKTAPESIPSFPPAGTPKTSGDTVSTSSVYTLADVAAHNGAASCWTAINENVYDLTNWISRHPGGEGAILSICGKDGTNAFEGQHGENQKPQQILATFKIGTLNTK